MKISRRHFIFGGAATLVGAGAIPYLSSCANSTVTKSGLKISDFLSEGIGSINSELANLYTAKEPTKLCVLTNSKGAEACITNFGARVVSLMVPDKNGILQDISLGLSSIKEYTSANNYTNMMGSMAGRTIGRTSNAKFTLEEKEYSLEKNYKNKHNIHGGKFGWHFQTWKILEETKNSVKMQITSPDGDGGFPGKVNFEVNYCLTENNSLEIKCKATTTKPTPLNVANHTYFNLEGNPYNDICDYDFQINCKKVCGLKEDICPDGSIIDIPAGDDLDFYSQPKKILKDTNISTGIWKYTGGYDYSYIAEANEKFNASVYCPTSGIKMELTTDRPIINFYDARDLDGSYIGKNNIPYKSRCAFCLEAQTYCDAVNWNSYPSIILEPGKEFTSTTEYKFSVA